MLTTEISSMAHNNIEIHICLHLKLMWNMFYHPSTVFLEQRCHKGTP